MGRCQVVVRESGAIALQGRDLNGNLVTLWLDSNDAYDLCEELGRAAEQSESLQRTEKKAVTPGEGTLT